MNFEIDADIFARLANLSHAIPQRVLTIIPEEDIKSIQCVRLEHKAGNTYAIASNRKCAAIYYLGETKEPDVAAHITNDKALIAQCEVEKPFNSKLFITVVPELGVASLKTTLGYIYQGNPVLNIPRTRLTEWPTWKPTTVPAASSGAMSWNLDEMEAFNKASPSGVVNFPEFIDAMQPVILRDPENPNWCGVFMSNLWDPVGKKAITAPPATLPEWWAK